MSDARALLRAHRAANRIEHPHAAYSDAGKLLCKLCRETVKSESLWETHIHGAGHRQRAAAQQGPEPSSSEIPGKRKHDDVDDMDTEQGEGSAREAEEEEEEAVRKKRSRTDMISPVGAMMEKENTATPPPRLARRTSSTPAQGVEISIPSRPATPLIGEGSATSTPNLPSLGRSPLIGFGSENAGTPNTNGSAQMPISTESLTVPQPVRPAGSARTAADVDEAEWAAFEAEIAEAEAPAASSFSAAGPNGVYADGVISAAALTADELASKSLDEENSRKKYHRDAEIADEKEDATRALEDEFEEMEELESRVRKLKERREQLRKGSIANLNGAAASQAAAGGVAKGAAGKENAGLAKEGAQQNAESEEDDDDDEDWDDGFRFRA